MTNLPLAGKRIIDFSRVGAGPLCCSYLARMGAEVIKVETRAHLDLSRNFQPMIDGIPGIERSGIHHLFHPSKKSCTLDTSCPKGVELFKELIKVSDVMVESFPTGTMEKSGLGYDTLRKINPSLVMLSISGFGRTGPEKQYVGYGRNLQAAGGLNALVGYVDGPPKSYIGLWSDTVASFTSAFAILSCLHYQSKTGIGQWIDLAIQETTAVQHGEPIMDYVMNHRSGQRMANRSHYAAPHNVYRCRGYDKWVAIDVSTDEEWISFCRAIGSPEWSTRKEFSDGLSRWQNQEELDKLIGSWTTDRNAQDVMEILQANGVPAGVCVDTENLAKDKQLVKRNFFPEIEHPEVGKTTVLGLPWRMSDSGEDRHHAPLLGQDNDYVFHELLGLSKKKIAQLIEEKIIH